MKTRCLFVLSALLLLIEAHAFAFYDPGTGRWLSKDPIGEHGGINLYGMVWNDPVNRLDALGLWGTPVHNAIINDLIDSLGIQDPVDCKCCGEIHVGELLKRANARMDGITYPGGLPDGFNNLDAQAPWNAHKHAMRANALRWKDTREEAEEKYNKFVNDELGKAAGHAISCADRANELQDGWPCNQIRSGIDALGSAIHSIADSLSPKHEGFQPWPPVDPAGMKHEKRAFAKAEAAAMADHWAGEQMDAYIDRKERIREMLKNRTGQILKNLLECCENANK